MCTQDSDIRFRSLGTPRRIWAISAIHAEAGRLAKLHDNLLDRIAPGDRIIYHGNYIGYGPDPCGTIDELLTFRRMALTMPGMIAHDIVYLRGGQEVMWQKLTQLQFAPNPSDVLLWMLSKGIAGTLEGYGFNAHDGIMAAKEGTMPLTRWTGKIIEATNKKPGHRTFASQLRRAAYTDKTTNQLLFVHAGIDPARNLNDQGDNLWWGGDDFSQITQPYAPYQKVIRGFDPRHAGMNLNCVTATIDGGCGFGGSLVCASFDMDGNIEELLEI